jgi:hypothetical protein
MMEPVLLLGTVMGVFFNAVSPGWLITVLLGTCCATNKRGVACTWLAAWNAVAVPAAMQPCEAQMRLGTARHAMLSRASLHVHAMLSRASLHVRSIRSPPTAHGVPHVGPHRNVLPASTECSLLSLLSTLSPASCHTEQLCHGGGRGTGGLQATGGRRLSPAPRRSFLSTLACFCAAMLRHAGRVGLARGTTPRAKSCHEAARQHASIQDLGFRINLK